MKLCRRRVREESHEVHRVVSSSARDDGIVLTMFIESYEDVRNPLLFNLEFMGERIEACGQLCATDPCLYCDARAALTLAKAVKP